MSNYRRGNWRDTALICENGHVINSSMIDSPERNKDYCPDCGSRNISTCQNCKANIQGEMHYENTFFPTFFDAPKYCHSCGKPFSWTVKEFEAAKELINLTDLTSDDKTTFIDTLNDISAVGPRNNVALAKVKIFLGKVGNGLREDIKEVITNVAAEVIKEKIKEM